MRERVWWRQAVIQERDKDTAESTKAKRIKQTRVNWWVSDQHLRHCCRREVGDWIRKVMEYFLQPVIGEKYDDFIYSEWDIRV